ncbi:MAG: DUF4365 domain-containing protein [Actinobacteria bacterium]|nr:DUF4365 domain-containing protein [Actinomycetota bacterium]
MSGRDEKVKEWFSRAFLTATSAVAGYKVGWELDDIDGVDATVKDGGIAVDWQLKATAHPKFDNDMLLFDLDVATYNKLRVARTAEAYLAVYLLPGDARSTWMKQSDKEMVLFRGGYWLKLTGRAPTSNRARIRLRIPIENQLDVSQIRDIMVAARRRVES